MIVRWEDLSPNQQRVLTSAMEFQNLARVRSDWQGNEDRVFNGGDNNRGRAYAEALIPAAVELIRAGMVGVVTRDPDFRQLSEDEAILVVQDLNNWWRYRLIPDLNDPLDPGLQPGGLVVDGWWTSNFSLKQVNRDRFRLASWNQPAQMERPTG
jgi:hypothetical protein